MTKIWRKIFLLSVILAAVSFSASAEELSPEWMRSMVKTKQEGIENLKKYRGDICPKFKEERNRDACNAAYDVIILRREVEKATLRLWLAGTRLDPMARGIVLEDIAPATEFNLMDFMTTGMFERTWRAFNVEGHP